RGHLDEDYLLALIQRARNAARKRQHGLERQAHRQDFDAADLHAAATSSGTPGSPMRHGHSSVAPADERAIARPERRAGNGPAATTSTAELRDAIDTPPSEKVRRKGWRRSAA